jgi:hypothetical protein
MTLEERERMRALTAALLSAAADQQGGRRNRSWSSIVSRAIYYGRSLKPRPVEGEFEVLRLVTIGELISGEMPPPSAQALATGKETQ